jgi:hypothetical protein
MSACAGPTGVEDVVVRAPSVSAARTCRCKPVELGRLAGAHVCAARHDVRRESTQPVPAQTPRQRTEAGCGAVTVFGRRGGALAAEEAPILQCHRAEVQQNHGGLGVAV